MFIENKKDVLIINLIRNKIVDYVILNFMLVEQMIR